MKYLTLLLALSLSLTLNTSAFAKTSTEAFSGCLVDALNGKERKMLAKWIFLSMAAHPEIKGYSKATKKDHLAMDKYIGKLITRLLTEECPKELKKALKTNPQALKQGFELVGRVATQELMTNKTVMKSLTNYMNYADEEKIKSVLTQ